MEAEANSRDAAAVFPILDELAAARLNKLVLLQGNDECADCRAPEPTWASVAQGVFVCTQCAGVHRSLGDAAVAALGACFACAGGCAPAARRGSLQRAPKVQASGKLRIELLYEPINH